MIEVENRLFKLDKACIVDGDFHFQNGPKYGKNGHFSIQIGKGGPVENDLTIQQI